MQLQHQIYGGATREPASSAPGSAPACGCSTSAAVPATWRCCAADLVGPTGEVVGVEVAPETIAIAERRVAAAGRSNVRFVRADLRDLATSTSQGPFDAIVGRWVLMYQPDPADLLRRLAAFAAPGGRDRLPGERPARHGAGSRFPRRCTTTCAGMLPPPELGGPELRMGPKLYRAFVAAGLPAPTVRIDTPVGGGPDWPGYGYLAATARSLLPMIVAMGVGGRRGDRRRHPRGPAAREIVVAGRRPAAGAGVRRMAAASPESGAAARLSA